MTALVPADDAPPRIDIAQLASDLREIAEACRDLPGNASFTAQAQRLRTASASRAHTASEELLRESRDER